MVPEPSARTRSLWRRAPWIAFAAAVLGGALIRLDQLGAQIPAGDEWHALHAARDRSYGWILTHLGVSDHSIPLALWDKAVADTVGLTETLLRAPVLLAGVAALVLLPLVLRAELGTKASVLLAWLLAISPLHVYFSRYARPYSPAFLCAVLATVAFVRWRRTRRRGWALVHVACAVLAAWLFPVFAPFVLAPYAWLALQAVVRPLSALRRPLWNRDVGVASCAVDGGRPGAAWPIALATGLGLVAVLAAPVVVDLGSVAGRAGGGPRTLADPDAVFEFMSGTNRALPAFAFGLAVLLGVVALRGRWSGIPGQLLFASACQAAALLVVRPAEIDVPITTTRYMLPALLLVLVCAALGLERLDRLAREEWPRVPRHAVSASVVAALLVLGPLPRIHDRPNAFTNHAAYQYSYALSFPRTFATRTFDLKRVSPFYQHLRENPAEDGECIVEAPWRWTWHQEPLTYYQRVHHWPMAVGCVGRAGETTPEGEHALGDPRFRFRTLVHVGDRQGLRERNVRYVIFHRDPPPAARDEARIEDARAWIAEYEERYGPPVFEDDDLTVFDVRER